MLRLKTCCYAFQGLQAWIVFFNLKLLFFPPCSFACFRWASENLVGLINSGGGVQKRGILGLDR